MNIIHRVSTLSLALLALVGLVPACSSPEKPPAPSGGVQVDQVEVVRGVPDDGADPAVVAIDIGDSELCSGALIAPDVVLTARHCVSVTAQQVSCPANAPQVTGERAPSSLKVLVGDDVATGVARATGREVVVPAGDMICNADI